MAILSTLGTLLRRSSDSLSSLIFDVIFSREFEWSFWREFNRLRVNSERLLYRT